MPRLRRAGRALSVPAALALLTATTAFAGPAATAHQPSTALQRVVPGTVLHPRPVRFVLPVSGYHLTARFGDAGGLWGADHTGLDFAAPTGTQIRAVASGVVTEAAYDGAYGNRTVVRILEGPAAGTELWYCHQDRIAVTVGQRVRAGQPIGAVGSTGNVTGPHLHLEVHPAGDGPVDPEPWLTGHGLTA